MSATAGPRSPRVRELLAFAACLVVVGGLAWATTGIRDRSVSSDHAVVGESFTMNAVVVKVTDVALVDAFEDYDTSHDAKGVFVVVDWTLEPRREPTTLSPDHIELRTAAGRSYLPTDTSIVAGGNPGFRFPEVVVFDVPLDEVAGAELVLPPPTAFFSGGYDRDLVVDLGLTERTARTPTRPTPQVEDGVVVGAGS